MPNCWTKLAVIVAIAGIGTYAGCGETGTVPGTESADEPDQGSRDDAAEAGEQPFTPEAGFTLLTLDDFDIFFGKEPGDQQTWAMVGNTIQCTGKPRGYIYTQAVHRNFTLRFDYRFEPPPNPDDEPKANTGCLVYITGEHRLWPVSLEVQGKHAEMGAIKTNGRSDVLDADAVTDDEAARTKARLPVGEWNSVEIVSRDGGLTAVLNGTKVCESRPGELSEGRLGFQSEDFEVHFRNIRIRPE